MSTLTPKSACEAIANDPSVPPHLRLLAQSALLSQGEESSTRSGDWYCVHGLSNYERCAACENGESSPRCASVGIEAPHQPAAFINALAEEGTRAEAINYLQKQWDENCELRRQLIALRASPAGNSSDLHWLVDWVHIYATEGHSWIGTPEADKLIELAQRKPTQADAERLKARAAIKSFSATESERS